MHWNHRVVDMTEENGGDPLFEIREVYYNDKGLPTGHDEPFVMATDIKGLKKVIAVMKKAIDQPVLTPEDFRGEAK